LSAAGVEVYTGVTGTVKEALDAYRSGRLTRAEAPTRTGHGGGRG
jgi:predicted Fe-Mo cluster-binding NifX family protein